MTLIISLVVFLVLVAALLVFAAVTAAGNAPSLSQTVANDRDARGIADGNNDRGGKVGAA
jgi:hypothetical protein